MGVLFFVFLADVMLVYEFLFLRHRDDLCCWESWVPNLNDLTLTNK